MQLQHLLYGRGAVDVAGVWVHGKGFKVPPVCGTLKAVRKTGWKKKPTDEMALLWMAANADISAKDAEMLVKLNKYRKLLNDIGKLERFPAAAEAEPDGRLRYQLKATMDTGRIAAANQPIQQVPGGGRLREAFIARPGYKLIVADYSGLEMVILAHFLKVWCDDDALVEDVMSEDIHSSTAKRCWPDELARYSPAEIKADPTLKERYRSPAKIVNYAINYGKGPEGLGVQITDENDKAIGTDKAREILDNYLDKAYPAIRLFHAKLLKWASEHDWTIPSLVGRLRKLSGLALDPNVREEKWSYLADYRRMLNTPMQASAADIMDRAMLKCNTWDHPDLRARGWYNADLRQMGVDMLAQIHDELVFEVPTLWAEQARDMIRDIMESAVKLALPLKVDIHICDNWREGK